MPRPLHTALLAATLAAAAPSMAAELPAFNVRVEGIAKNNAPIAEPFALCKPTADGKSTAGANQRPEISWSGAPKGTKSFAVFVIDPDVPADFTNAGKEGKTVAADAPRQDFFHWGVVDIPPLVKVLPGSADHAALEVGSPTLNDLGAYIPDATQFGGPCPPWNDARLHHYHFRVLALDVKSLGLPAKTTAKAALAAIKKGNHALGVGELTGTYSLNAGLKQ
jgi:phosphatidylethanolamine-binding protein (PEBP) family uncharacterized protein